MEHLWITYHFCSCVFGSLAEHPVACPELSWIAGRQSFSFYPFVVRCCNELPTEGHYPKILMMSDSWNQPFFGQVNQMLNKQKPLNKKTTAVVFSPGKNGKLQWSELAEQDKQKSQSHRTTPSVIAKILGVILLCKSTARCQAHAAQRPEKWQNVYDLGNGKRDVKQGGPGKNQLDKSGWNHIPPLIGVMSINVWPFIVGYNSIYNW